MGFFKRKRKPPGIDRATALACRPVRLPVVKREDLPEGKARVTVSVVAPRLLRMLGGRSEVERTFALDAPGCDGKADVKRITARFARRHKLSRPEAELSVTTFLKTLMSRGLVAISGAVPSGSKGGEGEGRPGGGRRGKSG